MPRGRKSTKVTEAQTGVAASSSDSVRIEMMKRIYIARDPESTPLTWLHHPECPPKAPSCEEYGCRAVSGLDVEAAIDAGWWNDVPGDH